jgi:dephospho-CoA kinase
MPALKRRAVLLLMASMVYCSTTRAGPYFNTYQTELDTLSRQAVKQLNDGRTAVINMFNALDAGNEHAADTERTRAVRLLTEAKEMFQQIAAKVGDRPLLLDPSTDEEKLVVFQFRAALDRRKLQFPRTERELAALAVTVVGEYAETVSKADFKGYPKNWTGSRAVILSEIELLYVGNLASIVWVISKKSTR